MKALSAGGGLYEKYTVSDASRAYAFSPRDGWGGYFVAGAAIALDRNRHFWIGASPRLYLANTGFQGNNKDRWFVITGDLSFRF